MTDKKFANTDNNTFVWDQSTAFETAVPIYNHRHIQPTQDCRCWVFEDTHTATRKSTQELNEAIRMAPAGTRSSGGATACVLQAWNAIQVKHSGRYSRCRMLALHEYSTATPLWKVATVAIMTPLPSLVIIALFEMVDLNPPSAGLELNRIFFAREWMTFTTFTVVLLQQFCTQVGQALPMTPLRLVGIACGTSALNVAFNYLLASFVGFPLPFTIQFSGLLHLVLECAALLISWRAYIRANPHVIAGIARAGMFFGWQCFTIVVYPVYYHAFTLVPDASVPRLACLLFLPAMKLTNRLVFLHMNRKSDGCEELSPQIVVLNADVVSALFVAFCVQYSPSLLMACIIAALKMTQVSLSLRDIYIVSQSVRSLQAEIQKQCSVKTKRRRGPKSSILDKVAEVHGHWAANHSILSDHGSSGASHVGLCCFSRRICSIHASRVSPLVPDPVVGCSRDNRALVHIGSAVKEQIWASKSEESQPDLQIRGEGTRHASPGLKSLEEQYVAAVAKLFYMVEFVVLVEYIEVIIPILYCTFRIARVCS